jgi:hypothetical protein
MFGAWTSFDSPRHADGTPIRPGGNNGHVMVDFGGQWLTGRMVAKGLGPHLYDRNYLWGVVQEAYPVADETPDSERPSEAQGRHEFEEVMSWFLGDDNPDAPKRIAGVLAPFASAQPLNAASLLAAVGEQSKLWQGLKPELGGPLYPPIQAMLMSPLGRLRPATAYRAVQFSGIVLAFAMGGAVVLLSRGRIWWPVGTTVILVYPGFWSTLALGQNSIFTLALLLLGWTLMAQGFPVSGGVLWGLLTYKPVWAIPFFVVLLLTRRWRICLAMLGTGVCLALATLPLVGWQAWLNWLRIGRQASWLYAIDENWVFLSRDLLNIPSRWLVDFSAQLEDRGSRLATITGWSLVLGVIGSMAGLAWRRREQAQSATGPVAAFFLLGAWLCCFHFMYYEEVLTALPVLLLFTEPERYLRPVLVGLLPGSKARDYETLSSYYAPRPACGERLSLGFLAGGMRQVAILNSVILTILAFLAIVELVFPWLAITASVAAPRLDTRIVPTPLRFSTSIPGTPWSTFCMLGLWLWCGLIWLRQNQSPNDERRNPNDEPIPK